MICAKIRAENFRNIEFAEVDFCDGVNILSGENGEGKTSLIEAIGYMSIGKSFRGASDAEIIRFGAERASVSVDFSDSIREQNIKVSLTAASGRRVEVNRVGIRRMSDMVGVLSTVIFCPEHLSIIKDGPAMRRAYIDIAVSQLRPLYIASLQRYGQILKQRNKLIRSAAEDRKTFEQTIDFWSEQLAAEAAVISSYRVDYVRRVRVYVARFFEQMTGGTEKPEIVYAGSSKDSEDFYFDRAAVKRKYMTLLCSNHERETAAGTTLWGVHKDDIDVSLNGKPARTYASQGQQRSLALALKLTEGEICREEKGEYPVFLLDDVLSELDAGRRDYLINEIRGRQVIMSSCEKLPYGDARVISVKDGRYGIF